jgi:hypothetical protein
MSKGFLVSAGMMLPISEAGNSGSSKLPALYICEKVSVQGNMRRAGTTNKCAGMCGSYERAFLTM